MNPDKTTTHSEDYLLTTRCVDIVLYQLQKAIDSFGILFCEFEEYIGKFRINSFLEKMIDPIIFTRNDEFTGILWMMLEIND